MNIVDKKVKLFFTNGMQSEGVVLSYNKESVVLKSEDPNCKELLIINDPYRNVIMTKVFDDKEHKDDSSVQPLHQYEANNKIPLIDIAKPKEELNLDIENLTKLRLLQIEEEKKNIAYKLKNPQFSATLKPVKYEQPNFQKLYIDHNSSKKTAGHTGEYNKKLPVMPRKAGKAR